MFGKGIVFEIKCLELRENEENKSPNISPQNAIRWLFLAVVHSSSCAFHIFQQIP